MYYTEINKSNIANFNSEGKIAKLTAQEPKVFWKIKRDAIYSVSRDYEIIKMNWPLNLN